MANDIHLELILASLEAMGDIVRRLEEVGFLLCLEDLEQMEKDMEEMVDALHENDQLVRGLGQLGQSVAMYILAHAWTALCELGPRRIQLTLRRAMDGQRCELDCTSTLLTARQIQRRLRTMDSDHMLSKLRGLQGLFRKTRPPEGFGSVATDPVVVTVLGRTNIFGLLARAERLVERTLGTGSFGDLAMLKSISELLILRIF
ncbi:uncharacterized protein LOC119941245 [Tachyglossus aculeatus]|uniref:uncharacterized protein LOC119941245 n=1 Tax=Tachyglossus aculeatus TaxID=9261 RepID=UPI0018F3997B|nr:uncharacterized protein LOC119941245 [Tachyglossus aculeatus]